MTAGDSWEKLSDAIDGPFERDIVDGLVNGFKALEPRIELAYKKAVLGAGEYPLRRLLTLRQELGQQLSGLQVSGTSQKKIVKALAEGQKAADEWAKAGLYKKDPKKFGNLGLGLTPGMAQQNPEALIAAAQRTHALSNYALGARGSQAVALINKISDTDLRGRIMGAVEFHLAQGDSWRNLEKTLKDSLEFAKNRAETVARTEMASAMVEGAKMRYEEEGIEYVQWNATGSSRTCGYCAPREGKVYELGKTVCPAHPNCRCALTPWDPEWEELGIASADEDAKQRKEVLEELEAAGKKPISSASPFERALGLEEPPKPFWEPPAISKPKRKARRKAKPVEPPKAVKPKDFLSMISEQVAAPPRHTVKGGDVQRLFDELKNRDGLEGKAMEKTLKFMEQEKTSILFTGGRALKTKKQADYIINNKAFREALARDHKRGGLSFSGNLHEALLEMEDPSSSWNRLGEAFGRDDRVPSGIRALKNSGKVGGHTYDGASFITIGAKKGQDKNFKVADLMNGVVKSLDRAASGKPYHAVTSGVDNMKHHWASILFHELGHNVYDAQGPIKIDRLIPRSFIRGKGIKGFKISQYGGTNVDELFAESFCAYALAPSKLREVSPATFKWVEDVLKKVTK